MFRAMILWLAGATFEVRVVSITTGKDIPGRCIFKGGYWKARKIFNTPGYRMKPGHVIRLQAVAVTAHRFEKPKIPEQIYTEDEVQEFKDKLAGENVPRETHDIGTSNARQSEFMAEHQDEPNVYTGTDKDDHDCDSNGPMEYDPNLPGYEVTCSICGGFPKRYRTREQL